MAQLSRIMMVEDDPDIQTVARVALEALGGYTVEVCSGGREALTRVGEFAPQLVLLDVMMPDMDGPSVMAELRQRPDSSQIPIIFMTAKAQAHEVEAYRNMGALDVISKPFDPMTLSQVIGNIWASNAAAGDAR